MNLVQSEADQAIAEEYENVLADNGRQAEALEIDGQPVPGTVFFDPTTIELVMGGTQEDVTAAVRTLKRYFPDGKFPIPFNSVASMIVGGQTAEYEVRQLNGNRDNRATITIGLAATSNRK